MFEVIGEFFDSADTAKEHVPSSLNTGIKGVLTHIELNAKMLVATSFSILMLARLSIKLSFTLTPEIDIDG